jgi:outer membrane protein OmpA-like peptidoglycan-associated protein
MQHCQFLSGITLGVLMACVLAVGEGQAKSIVPADAPAPAAGRPAATELEEDDRAALTALIAEKQAAWAGRRSTAAPQARRDRALAEGEARKPARGVVLRVGDVRFAPGQATPTAATLRKLSPLVQRLRVQPHREIAIVGYADSSGPAPSNRALAQRRVDTVRAFLIANGIAPRRVTVRGYGEAPAAFRGRVFAQPEVAHKFLSVCYLEQRMATARARSGYATADGD